MKGDFFTEMFGNDTVDIDVRALLHGYNLVNWDQEQGVYVLDPSVATDVKIATDADGNRTYYIEISKDLYYSDGTQINAWDYAFSLLLMMSPEIEEIGGKIYRAEHILGYNEYITGELPYLTGVGVIDDHQLAITLDHEFLPYFFETGLLLCVPYPIDIIAPGCKVYAGDAVDLGDGYGYGIRIGNEDETIEEPIYTAELLQETILDPETGYNSHPAVSSGPYVLTDYDYETAHFVINDYYKGAWMYSTLPEGFQFEVKDFEGVGTGTVVYNSHTGPNIYQVMRYKEDGEENPMYLVKPTIEKISFTVADNDTMAYDLATGKFHLVNKVVYGPTILQCLGGFEGNITPVPDHEPKEEEPAEDEEEEELLDYSGIRSQNYPRIGLAFATFTYDWPTVHEMEVRQAIAWCMDREQLTQDYCQGFGTVVNGYYGIEQWEYLIVTDQLAYPINFLYDPEHVSWEDELEDADLEDEELGEGGLPAIINPAYLIYLDHEPTEEELAEWERYPNMYASTLKEYEEMSAAWEELNLDNLTYYNVYDTETDPERKHKIGIEKANALLDYANWTLNRDGEPYRPGVDDVRCKMIDDELVALDLTMMYPRGNHIVDTIQENFIDNLNQVGIQLTLVPEDMEELLKSYYREKERTTDMIYLATNFHVIVDPSITYSTDDTANHLIWNNTYSDDEDLWCRAVDMRKTDPKDVYDYVVKWIYFQERYNEVLPTIPIYSNIYYDFYTYQLQNYWITAHVTWTQAILESYFGEELEPVEGEGDFGEILDEGGGVIIDE
jgi:ABC-type transport system substrate-binding protein